MASIEQTGLSIVKMVGEFKNQPVPIDFIARQLGKSRGEIESYLVMLEQEGAIRREGDLVFAAAQ